MSVFKAPTFRGQLLAKMEVEGPDGGIWKLGKQTGQFAHSRPWCFSRRRKDDKQWIAMTDTARGLTAEEAIDALEEYLHKRNGIEHLRRNDEWYDERRARIDDAFERAKAACHSGMTWEIDDWSNLIIRNPEDYYRPIAKLYSSDVANRHVDVDATIKSIIDWRPSDIEDLS